MKALLIRRDVILRRVHDLVELQHLLPPADASAFAVADLELLNPWTMEGRYPAEPPPTGQILETVEAAGRIVEAARQRSGEAPPR